MQSACPRCGSSSAPPFVAGGVCLRCAGARVLGAIADPALTEEDIAFAARTGDADLPDRIGDFEIIEELGRGGMARVFAARQLGLGRIVALKAIPAARHTADLELRFLREAQTVAGLRHPHIVAVHDSGRASGFVYFSMDYIEGGDLARRLRERPFAPRETAVLLHKVAGALAYTHREGVLHRDLKPSNILLEGDEPRVADFGLAAQLETGGDLTAATSVLGTPHYLAPEAMRHGSAALTVASDLYALGVILFEMLTGRTPFAGASPAELAALVENAEPPALRVLAPAVPRDLETICLKCLEREPARRYASAGALAEDLRRSLGGETILARPPGWLERAGKFARRHRPAVIAATASVLVLVAATAVSAALAIRARRAEAMAAHEARTSRELADFLQKDLLGQATPGIRHDPNVTLHTVLDRAARDIEKRFRDQPLVAADIRAVIGEVYDSLGDYATAEPHYLQALALRRHHLGLEHPRTLAAMHELVTLRLDQGKLVEADKLAGQTLALRRRVLGPEHPDTLATAELRSIVLNALGLRAEADALLTDTLATARRVLDGRSPQLVRVLHTLGTIRLGKERLSEAEAFMKEAIALQAAAPDSERIFLTTLENDLAIVYQQQRKLDLALPLLQRVLDVRRRVLGPEHPHTLIVAGNLASVYKSQGKLAESEALQRTTVESARRVFGAEHPRVLTLMYNLADTYRTEKKYDDSAALLSETLAVSRRVLGENHQTTINALAGLGDIYLREGDAARAEPLLREAFLAQNKTEGALWRIETARAQLGLVLLRLGRHAEAEPLLLEAHHTLCKLEGTMPASSRKFIAETGEHVVELYTAWGKPEQAAAWKQETQAAKP